MTIPKYGPEDIARWQAKIASGMTRKAIAIEEGIAQGALIGAMHRASGGTKVPRGPRGSKKPKPAPKVNTGPKNPVRPDMKRPEQDGLTILELGPSQCKFPVTHNRPHKFCGKPTQDGKVYCPEHDELCNDRTGEARRSLKAATRWTPADVYS